MLAAFAILHFLERLGVVAVAFVFLRECSGRWRQIATGLVLALALARGLVRGTLVTRVNGRLHRCAADALLRGDLFDPTPLGADDSEAAVLEGVHSGSRIVTQYVPQLAADGLASLVLAAVIGVLEPTRVLAAGSVAVTVAAGLVVLFRRVTARESESAWQAYRPLLDSVCTAISGRLELVANGVDPAFRHSLDQTIALWSRTTLRSQRILSLVGRFPLIVGATVAAVILLGEGSLRGVAPATALAEAALFASAFPAFAGALSAAHELTKVSVTFGPMAGLLAGAAPHAGGAESPEDIPCNITCERVSFSYAGAQAAALSHVDVDWPVGSLLILSGANGSGKSTLLRLLLGITSSYDGTIRVGAHDLAALDGGAWRRKIGYLPQRPYLADRATVAEAIALTAPHASAARMQSELERVDLWPALAARSRDPFSLKAGTLSTGQRQRLALARLFASDRAVLLLDEPDANLDAAGIQMVSKLLRELSSTKRIAVVAHTAELLSVGDLVVTLEGGRVRSIEAR